MKTLPILDKQELNPLRSAPTRTKTRASLKYPVNDYPRKQFPAPNSPQTPLNPISMTILKTPRPFTQFQPKVKAIKLQKSAKIFLT